MGTLRLRNIFLTSAERGRLAHTCNRNAVTRRLVCATSIFTSVILSDGSLFVFASFNILPTYFLVVLWDRVALETLDRLTESLDFTDYASRIIHPIVRTLDSTPELRSTAMDTLSSLVFQLGKKVAVLASEAPCNFS